ncbi:outer membrane protein assembly factor BamB family protein [Streptomyces griseoluteus]|uniref:outer membrane protein assembly factor BamB family protein n=1 Tax=Streptomyces griseoluteus TaxID=29306 RepID=UPI003653842E
MSDQPPSGPPQDQPPTPSTPAVPPAGPQPTYGYPQAPPPQPQSGYGYPAAPQQPGYGHPAQPPTVVAGDDVRARENRAIALIVLAAVVAIGLIIGSGVWYSRSSDGGGSTRAGGDKNGTGTATGGKEKVPDNPAADVLFKVPQPKTEENVVTTPGSWLSAGVYAKSGIAEITGYDPADGHKKWTLKLPGPVCAATEHVTADGRTGIVYQPSMPTRTSRPGCTQVAGIDVRAGTKLWTKSIGTGEFATTFQNVTVAGKTVAVGGLRGGAAYDIGTGKVLWQPKPGDDCDDVGYGGGTRLVAVRKCGGYGDRTLSIQNVDPTSGKVISEYKMGAGIEYAGIVSTDPLVVGADAGHSASGGSGVSDYFSIDNRTGRLLARIPVPGDTYDGECDTITLVEECKGVAAGQGKLYLATKEHSSGGKSKLSRTNEVVAFDLATGKQTGQRAAAGEDYTLFPLRMDGGNLIAYKNPPYDKGGQIVSIDGASFKSTTLMELPADQADRALQTGLQPDFSEYRYSQGKLFMAAPNAAKPLGKFDKDKNCVVAFGTRD